MHDKLILSKLSYLDLIFKIARKNGHKIKVVDEEAHCEILWSFGNGIKIAGKPTLSEKAKFAADIYNQTFGLGIPQPIL